MGRRAIAYALAKQWLDPPEPSSRVACMTYVLVSQAVGTRVTNGSTSELETP